MVIIHYFIPYINILASGAELELLVWSAKFKKKKKKKKII
jgi:hypothetical protein